MLLCYSCKSPDSTGPKLRGLQGQLELWHRQMWQTGQSPRKLMYSIRACESESKRAIIMYHYLFQELLCFRYCLKEIRQGQAQSDSLRG